MALTKEDLLAIKSVVDDSVSELKSDVVGLKGEVKGLSKRVDSLETEVKGLGERMDSVEGEIVGLKGEVKGLSERMDSVEGEIVGLKGEVKGLSQRMDSVEGEVKGLSHRMDSVEIDIKEIKIVQLENRVIPVIEDMQQYQMDVYKRYHEETERFEEKIALIDLTAKTVAKHSIEIQELRAKMA